MITDGFSHTYWTLKNKCFWIEVQVVMGPFRNNSCSKDEMKYRWILPLPISPWKDEMWNNLMCLLCSLIFCTCSAIINNEAARFLWALIIMSHYKSLIAILSKSWFVPKLPDLFVLWYLYTLTTHSYLVAVIIKSCYLIDRQLQRALVSISITTFQNNNYNYYCYKVFITKSLIRFLYTYTSCSRCFLK